MQDSLFAHITEVLAQVFHPDHLFIYAIGLLAQVFFFGRIFAQWILSEKAKKVVSPSIFWILSIGGSYLFCIYGWLRNDFSIILGQFISYYIYLWNLKEKGVLQKLHFLFRWILLLTPVIAVIFQLQDAGAFIENFFKNEDVPMWLLVFGSLGQIIFTLRFVYQWFYSVRKKESVLPVGFWIISLIGSSAIVAYAVFRADPILILGQSMGFIAYIRNIILYKDSLKQVPQEA